LTTVENAKKRKSHDEEQPQREEKNVLRTLRNEFPKFTGFYEQRRAMQRQHKKPTHELRTRGRSDCEYTRRFEATTEVVNKLHYYSVDKDSRQAAKFLCECTDYYKAKDHLLNLLGASHVTPSSLMRFRLRIQVRTNKALLLLKEIKEEGFSCCTKEEFLFFQRNAPVPRILSLRETTGIDVDNGAARFVPIIPGLRAIFESTQFNQDNLIDLSNKAITLVISADGYQATGSIEVEQANIRIMNLKSHHRAPYASFPIYMGAHKESYEKVMAFFSVIANQLLNLKKNGLHFKCPAFGCCACAAGIPIDSNNMHTVTNIILLLAADMKWFKMGIGAKASVCQLCGMNCAHNAIDKSTKALDYKSATEEFFSEIAKFVESDQTAKQEWQKMIGVLNQNDTDKEYSGTIPLYPPTVISAFRNSNMYKIWQERHPQHIGPDLLSFLNSKYDIVTDALHLGLNVVRKLLIDTFVAYAVGLEANGDNGIDRLLQGLRLAKLPQVAKGLEYALKDYKEYTKKSSSTSETASIEIVVTEKLIESYVNRQSAEALRKEATDLGLQLTYKVGSQSKPKTKVMLKNEIKSEITKLGHNKSISANDLMKQSRFDTVEIDASFQEQQQNKWVQSMQLSAPNLISILSGRLKLIGRECKTVMQNQNFKSLARVLNPDVQVYDTKLKDRLAGTDAQIEAIDVHLAAAQDELDQAADEVASRLASGPHNGDSSSDEIEAAITNFEEHYATLRRRLEDWKNEREELVDQQLRIIHDIEATASGVLEDNMPEKLKEMVTEWELFVAVLNPWIQPTHGDKSAKMAELEDHESRLAEWKKHHNKMGLSTTSFYYHWLIDHSEQARLDWMKKDLPFPIQEIHCELSEHINKLQKKELAALIAMLWQSPNFSADRKLRNAFYHVLHDWLMRLVLFPDTIHVRKDVTCSVCHGIGHRKDNSICPLYNKDDAQRAPTKKRRKKSSSVTVTASSRKAAPQKD